MWLEMVYKYTYYLIIMKLPEMAWRTQINHIVLFIYLVIQQTLLSKATYKWGYYRSNQNQQKSNNMQVHIGIIIICFLRKRVCKI